MKKIILIIDKDINDYLILKERLEQHCFIVHTTADYQEGHKKVFKLKPDLIIYNFLLFLLSEKEFNEEITRRKMFIPVIMVNSTKKEEEIFHAFDMGAADYITKPFNSREVEARVKAILRRIEITKSTEVEKIEIGNLILNPAHYEIDLKTHKVNLSKRELQVLLLLIHRKVISREEIIRYIWGCDYYGGSRIVDMNISNLRRKIEENPKKPQYIKTIKGYGYRLDETYIKEG
jgi:two-component system, OmpR family, alkaline phosphatase synthesis response regulator PhoP